MYWHLLHIRFRQFIVKLANYKQNATKRGRNGSWKEEIYIDTNRNEVNLILIGFKL